MTDDAAEAHTYDVRVAILPGALGWASTQGPLGWASTQGPAPTAAHTAQQPPGGPPPEEADIVSEGRRHSMIAAQKLK